MASGADSTLAVSAPGSPSLASGSVPGTPASVMSSGPALSTVRVDLTEQELAEHGLRIAGALEEDPRSERSVSTRCNLPWFGKHPWGRFTGWGRGWAEKRWPAKQNGMFVLLLSPRRFETTQFRSGLRRLRNFAAHAKTRLRKAMVSVSFAPRARMPPRTSTAVVTATTSSRA